MAALAEIEVASDSKAMHTSERASRVMSLYLAALMFRSSLTAW